MLDPELVGQRLDALLGQLGSMHPGACCAGAAGAEVPAARERLESLLQGLLPGCRITVVHDARLVLAAAGLRSGIALIAGTGSVAYGQTDDGCEARRGGWGWMIGDEGSAVWVTREAAREVMRRADGAQPLGSLGQALLRACSARDSLEMTARLHAMHEPMQWAALAAAVFSTVDEDPGAASVVQRAGSALSDLARAVGECLQLNGPIVLAGGLLLNQPALEAAVREQLGPDCVRLEEPPVRGAVRLAEELLTQ